jgi:Asp-tRNA(Asn)/Glu-tRNA(Gln) amidotransferase A subunit family amidase
MMVELTVASEFPAFQNLTAKEDAFTVGWLRSHGGILLDKTNMPPMANGGYAARPICLSRKSLQQGVSDSSICIRVL